MGLGTTFKLGWGQWLQGKRAYASKGAYEREMLARACEKAGHHEMASLYRACLCQQEWHDQGYEGSFGNYRKVRQGVSLCEATNGAYGTPEEKWALLEKEARDAGWDPNKLSSEEKERYRKAKRDYISSHDIGN